MAQQYHINLTQLRKLMVKHFALDELRSLCMDLDLSYDDLNGNTLTNKIVSLIEHLQHREQLEILLVWLKKERPEVDWDKVCRPTLDGGGYEVSRRRAQTFALLAIVAVVIFSIALLVLVRSGCLCTYQGEDDYETIEQIIRAESLAVTSADLNIISDIFASDAYLKQTDNVAGSVTEWFDPISHYRALFATTQFSEARHTRITGVVNGSYARFTSGSQGVYVENGEPGKYDHPAGDPNEEEVWTLEKNFWGCWEITRFEFH